MNQTIKDMLERRSCRKFKSEMVPIGIINQIVEAGLYAASGHGKQATRIVVITNKAIRDKFMVDNRKIGGWDESVDPFYGAPVILLVLADKSVPTSVCDASLVMGNLMLAAHSLGIGSIWINRARQEFEMDEYKEFLKEIGLEGEFEGVGHCAIGYIDGELPKAAPRKTDHVIYVE